jgi:hypothetical protein
MFFDFLMSDPALRRGQQLLRLDDLSYRAAFPRLSIVAL